MAPLWASWRGFHSPLLAEPRLPHPLRPRHDCSGMRNARNPRRQADDLLSSCCVCVVVCIPCKGARRIPRSSASAAMTGVQKGQVHCPARTGAAPTSRPAKWQGMRHVGGDRVRTYGRKILNADIALWGEWGGLTGASIYISIRSRIDDGRIDLYQPTRVVPTRRIGPQTGSLRGSRCLTVFRHVGQLQPRHIPCPFTLPCTQKAGIIR